MERDEVILFIQKQYHDGLDLHATYVRANHPSVFWAAKKHFGKWTNAIESSNISYRKIAKHFKWSKEEVIETLKNLEEKDLIDKNLRKNHGALYSACINIFGSRKKALLAAGLDYEDTLQNIPWTRERIISVIQMFHLKKMPLNFKYISANHSKLKKRAEKIFGSWGEAILAAGIDYEEIKKNKGWAKPSLGEDGILYVSQIEGLVANVLCKLKEEDKIISYTPQAEVSPARKWTCDFSIKLVNGTTFLLEIDSLGDKKKGAEEFQEKLAFYEKAKVLYCKVLSPNNVENIINRYTAWYSIPIKDTLITTHKDPDGDALSSSRAIYDFLLSKGKKAAFRFSGEIPKNLSWIVEGRESVKKVPDWTENIIVLDCAPTADRIGWELPNNIPIYNIDHHANRLSYNDPDNDVHIIDACSTASILFNYFGIKDDILSVGVYTDTLFTKSLTEVFYFLLKLDVNEEIINKYISRINANPDKKLWRMLGESDVHRCRNGFIIVETSECAPDIIESFMQILSKISESVCLLYGNDGNVKLRTSNESFDVSKIANQHSGGGHPFAAMCNVKNKVSEFKSKIISLDIPKPCVIDGYGEDIVKSNKQS